MEPTKDKKIGKIITTIVVLVIAAFFVFDAFYSVSEQQEAVVTQFGKVVKTENAGIHFKVPFIQRVNKVDITTHGTGIGYSIANGGQNIVDTSDGVMITSDFNLINIDFYLEYKVSDSVAYLFNTEAPEDIMANVALANIRSVVSNYTVDEAITTGKGQIQSEVKAGIIRDLQELNVGLSVLNITVQDSEPPTEEVTRAFKAVETAKQGKETAVNNAKKYENEQLPVAEAQADRIVQNAQAEKEARIAEAEGQAARFEKMYEQYKQYPLITKKRLFYETMEDVLPGLKVIITDGNTEEILPIEKFVDLCGEDSTSDNSYNSYDRSNNNYGSDYEIDYDTPEDEYEKGDDE